MDSINGRIRQKFESWTHADHTQFEKGVAILVDNGIDPDTAAAYVRAEVQLAIAKRFVKEHQQFIGKGWTKEGLDSEIRYAEEDMRKAKERLARLRPV